MKIGDFVTCSLGLKWVIYDMTLDSKYLYLVDFETNLKTAYLSNMDIIYHEEKPRNVRWMYIEKRKKTNNVLGLWEYLK